MQLVSTFVCAKKRLIGTFKLKLVRSNVSKYLLQCLFRMILPDVSALLTIFGIHLSISVEKLAQEFPILILQKYLQSGDALVLIAFNGWSRKIDVK